MRDCQAVVLVEYRSAVSCCFQRCPVQLADIFDDYGGQCESRIEEELEWNNETWDVKWHRTLRQSSLHEGTGM